MIIQSPSSKFIGTVTLPDMLMLPQVAAWDEAMDAVTRVKPDATIGDVMSDASLARLALPGILVCVERWEISGIPEQPTVETWPFTPRGEALKLLGVLLSRIHLLIDGEQVPPA